MAFLAKTIDNAKEKVKNSASKRKQLGRNIVRQSVAVTLAFVFGLVGYDEFVAPLLRETFPRLYEGDAQAARENVCQFWPQDQHRTAYSGDRTAEEWSRLLKEEIEVSLSESIQAAFDILDELISESGGNSEALQGLPNVLLYTSQSHFRATHGLPERGESQPVLSELDSQKNRLDVWINHSVVDHPEGQADELFQLLLGGGIFTGFIEHIGQTDPATGNQLLAHMESELGLSANTPPDITTRLYYLQRYCFEDMHPQSSHWSDTRYSTAQRETPSNIAFVNTSTSF